MAEIEKAFGCRGCTMSKVIAEENGYDRVFRKVVPGDRLGCFHPEMLKDGQPVGILEARTRGKCGPDAVLRVLPPAPPVPKERPKIQYVPGVPRPKFVGKRRV